MNSHLRLCFLAVFLGTAFGTTAFAQIRIASYNTETNSGDGTPASSVSNVIGGIGTESINGFAKRVDILCLQEQNNVSGNTTTADILAMMNTRYGSGIYAKSSLVSAGITANNTDSSAVIYDSTKFSLIAEKAFGNPSTNGMPRQEIRYQFRPTGYSSASDFYVYVVHYKATGGDADDDDRRNVEAGGMRADAAALPAGSRILYVGDFNLTNGTSEAAWATIRNTTNNAQSAGIDPMNSSWANANLTHSTTNLDSRLDFQFQTAPTNDGQGFSLISGSYHPFSNNNVSNGGQSPNSFVRSASDHYPLVADYRLPAKMNVSVGSAPSQVIVGANVGVNVTVTNSAPVQVAIGADGLDYALTSNGSLSGSGNGTDLPALAAGNNHSVLFNTATVGLKSGTITVNSSSQEVGNGTFAQQVSTTVIDHSQPSLDSASSVNVATIDFGIRGRDLGGGTSAFSISNRFGNGTTAGLDLDSAVGVGSTGQLATNASTFTNLSAGSSRSLTAIFSATVNGTWSSTYTFNLSDQNLPGATTRGPLTLILKGIVATPGDTDLNGKIDGSDYAHLDNTFGLEASQGDIGGWANGDFNADGKVDGADFTLADFYFGLQTGTLAGALAILNGDESGLGDSGSLPLQIVQEHFEQFGDSYRTTFLALAPEPGSALGLVAFALGCASRLSRVPRNRTTS